MKRKILWSATLVAAILAAYFVRGIWSIRSSPSMSPVSARQAVSDEAVVGNTKARALQIPNKTALTGTTPEPAIDNYEKSPESKAAERFAVTKRSIDSTYGKAMYGLGLTPKEVGILRDFLVEKAEVGWIASDVSVETPGRTSENHFAAVKGAKASVDAEMLKYFGEEKYAEIELMQETASYLILEQTELGPALAKAGALQLDPVQAVQFATAMAEAMGWGLHSVRPTWRDSVTGLTNRDIAVLEKAAGFLSREQVSVLRSVLISRNRYLTEPIPVR